LSSLEENERAETHALCMIISYVIFVGFKLKIIHKIYQKELNNSSFDTSILDEI
jgi:hypothetical protein